MSISFMFICDQKRRPYKALERLSPVRVCEPFTPDLHAVVDWLVTCHMDTVAMASTGVYGVPIFELLEQRGLTPYLVNARHVKTVPGRKTDWNDAQWLQKRHALGLLQASFRPDAEIRVLRTLLRHRAALIEPRAPPMLHLQKTLKLMHMQLSEVLTEITGVTGQAIWRAIVAGERDPVKLAPWRRPACESSADKVAKALSGTWRDALLCMLQPALERFDSSTQKSAEPPTPWPRTNPGSTSQHPPRDDARASRLRLTGMDLVAVTGLSASIAQTILAEIGTDMTKFPTVQPCCAWLGLAPHHDVSGGRVWRSRTLQVVHRATQAFRPAAQSVARSHSAVGAYCRSMRARLGPEQATVATAHQIARVVYHRLKDREAFQGKSALEYERERRERELKHLGRRAKTLGYTLIPVGTSHPAPAS